MINYCLDLIFSKNLLKKNGIIILHRNKISKDKLPNYYKYLNTCNMAWVYPTDHFGQGHAKIDDKKENLIIKTDTDGCYTVLLMGTRCDAWALKHWQGTERHKHPDKWSCNL